MMGYAIFWIILFVVLVIIEFVSVQLLTIWFAIGALVAVFFSGAPFWVQLTIFAVVSLVLLLFTRPLVKKLLKKSQPTTNADLFIGETALVIESIDNERLKGRVTLKGVDWTARSTDGMTIESGETVHVDNIDSTKLFVSIKKQKN